MGPCDLKNSPSMPGLNKLELGRVALAGQDAPVTALVLGMPQQTLGSWIPLRGNANP
jgi:hypothetical protein